MKFLAKIVPFPLVGERKRKILCSRESDRVVVSDQRCHGTARPAVITEPCNTECELRSVFVCIQSTVLLRLAILRNLTEICPLTPDTGGMWLGKVSAQPSAAWDIVLWKYIVPKSAMQTARLRRWTTATVVVNTNLMIRKVAMETVTQVAGSTLLGQR